MPLTSAQGFCFVNYSTPAAAAAVIAQLNGIEFPPHSNSRLKVMYAEQLGARQGSNGVAPCSASHHSGSQSGGMHSAAQAAAVAHLAGGARSPMSLPTSSPSPVHTPLSPAVNLSPEVHVASVAAVQETLANMTMPRVASANGVEELDTRRMASPIASGERSWACSAGTRVC
jgi:hypothetical protein